MWLVHQSVSTKQEYYDSRHMAFVSIMVSFDNVIIFFFTFKLFQPLIRCLFLFDYHFAVFNSTEKSPCQFSINHSSAESLMKLINGFLIAITCRGNIVIVTPSIEQHLGHCQVIFNLYIFC